MSIELFRPIYFDSLPISKLEGFNIFLNNTANKFILYKDHKLDFTLDDVNRLKNSGINRVYIRSGEFEDFNKKIENFLKNILICENDCPPEVKSENCCKNRVLLQTTSNIVNEIFSYPREINTKKINRLKDLVKLTLNNVTSTKEVITAITNLVENNYYEFSHGVSVLTIGILLARKAYSLDKDELTDLGVGLLLHDYGKIYISREILDKPTKLSIEEFQKIQDHPRLGFEYLRNQMNFEIGTLECIIHHHERDDGLGYPDGIPGSKLGRNAKISILADVFSSLISDRPYRKALSLETSLSIMKNEMNSHFDKRLFKLFEELLTEEVIKEINNGNFN